MEQLGELLRKADSRSSDAVLCLRSSIFFSMARCFLKHFPYNQGTCGQRVGLFSVLPSSGRPRLVKTPWPA